MDLQPGDVFAGHRIEGVAGRGGMGVVYRAVELALDRVVALKTISPALASDPSFRERFVRESKAAAGIDHPNVLPIFSAGEEDGIPYIAMRFVEGEDLRSLLRREGPLPPERAVAIAVQVLKALRFAHRRGIVHRDIKPHNAIVDDEGRVKVTDFGIARAGGAQMTEVGSIVGTAQYLSPEQARGAPVDQPSDLYSTGIVLYELLTGTVPFTGQTPVEIAMKHLQQTPAPPSSLRPEVPRDLDYVVLRALAKDPADRY
ncbi:MAG TPA: protein kinase, partial [Solirubrobacteraceae bacterium]|nr:protein kinase [Solirubrobacteraceae bacterium]